MKFLSSFIKHSLQPARRGDAELPAVTRIDPVSPVSAVTKNMHPAFAETALSVDPATSVSVDSSQGESELKTAQSEPTTRVSLAQESVPDQSSRFTSELPPTSEQVYDSPDNQYQPLSSQSIEAESIYTASTRVEQEATTEIAQAETSSSAREKTENQSAVDSLQLNMPDSVKFSGNQQENVQTTSKKSVPFVQSESIESSSNSVKNFTDGTADSSKLAISEESSIHTEQPTAVAVPLQQAPPPTPLNEAKAAYLRDNRNTTSRQAETPPVKIGNINILIDDQAAAKPAAKPASTATSPSIPFGLRGL